MIKIIAGEFKGRLLKTPSNIRPIIAHIKKSVFDILTPYIENCLFLDLYAGSGAVGIEAISRGAKFCVFVEKEKYSLRAISANIISLNCQDRAYVVKADILKGLIWIEKTKRILNEKFQRNGFDIIFVGAPYYIKKRFDKNYNCQKVLTNYSTPTIELIFNSQLLSTNGILVVQHSEKEFINTDKFLCFRKKQYGDTIVSFFKNKL